MRVNSKMIKPGDNRFDIEVYLSHIRRPIAKKISRQAGGAFRLSRVLMWSLFCGIVLVLTGNLLVYIMIMIPVGIGLLQVVGIGIIQGLIIWCFRMYYVRLHTRRLVEWFSKNSTMGRLVDCPACNYDQRGTDGDHCPECGCLVRVFHET